MTKTNVQNGALYSYGTGNTSALGDAGPHAVTSINGTQYSYDNNGNMTSGDGRTINYTTFDKPDVISKGDHTTQFLYGPNRNRFKRVDNDTSGGATTTLYLGNVERIEKPDGVIETKRYIGGKHIVTTTSVNPLSVELTVFTDHIGSTYALMNRSTGGMEQGMSFDAFGLRRESNWNDLSVSALSTFDHSASTKGFTGHEQLDEVGLIHMNGRVYDPLLGRFLSADSVIDGVTSTQGYNRYSYVHNNPLSYTDPTGFSRWRAFRDKILKPVASIAIYFVPGINFLAAGFISGYISTGSLVGAVAGAFSSGLVGPLSGLEGLTGFVARGVAGGFTSALSGGKFGHGFISAGIGGSVGPKLGRGFAGVVKRAVLGGTLSRLTGGKFANGAAFAAFASIVAESANSERPGASGGEILFPEGGSTDINDYDEIRTNGIGADRKYLQGYANENAVPVFYNPSKGPIRDIFESIGQKFIGRDPLAQKLSSLLVNVDHPMLIIGHSQGTLTVTNAGRTYGLPNGSTLVLNSPVVTQVSGQAAAKAIGGSLVYNLRPGDISNILAPSFNPLRFGSGVVDLFCGACIHRKNGFVRP